MQIEHKKTVLNDEAALYHHSEQISEKEKWAQMSGAQKWEHFKTYYLLKVVGVTAAVGLIVWILGTIFAPKKEVLFSVAIVNQALGHKEYLQVQEEFDAILELDPETQKTIFDGGYDFVYDEMNSVQKFALHNATGELDVAIMPMSEFVQYAVNGNFSPVEKHLAPKLYESLSAYLIESGVANTDGTIPKESICAYGICIDASWLYEENEPEEPVVLAIGYATQKDETIAKFLEYIFR